MLSKPGQWTRRQFSQCLGVSAAAALLGGKAHAAAPQRHLSGLAFAGSAAGTLDVFHVSGPRWRPVQQLAAPAPAHLESHPTLPILYVVHAVAEWDNLPRGAVSAYTIALDSGRLTLRNTQPLSLSATCPRHAAISPDGRHLLVAAEGGGVYNVLPVATDGTLGPPTAIRKELGLIDGTVAKIAAPRHIQFRADGTAISADPGQESISLFNVEHEAIHPLHRIRTHPAHGPSQIALSGPFVYALNQTSGSIAVHPVNSVHVAPPTHTHIPAVPGPAHMAMHPSGKFLVTASPDGLKSLAIDPAGCLSVASATALQMPVRTLSFAASGTHLLGACASGQIVSATFHDGVLGQPRTVASMEAASSILFRPA